MLSPVMKEVLAYYPDAVFIGGSALQLHGVRKGNDVDAWVGKVKNQVDGADLTSDKNIWGQINMPDIDKVAQVKMVGKVRVKVMDLATIFIYKADANREKDIDDLDLIAKHISPMDIARRLKKLTEYNPGDDFQMIQENTMQEIALHFGSLSPDVVEASGLRDEYLDNALLVAFNMLTSNSSKGMRHARY